jgi:16S rRNA processing protein RimM
MTEQPDEKNPVLLEIGKILKPHGLSGELIVDLSTNRTERLNPGSVISTQEFKLNIKTSRPHQKKFIVHFEGIENREKADELRGESLFAEPIKDETVWVHELVGAEVIDQKGINRGLVTSVVHNPASDLLELEDGNLVPLNFLTSYKAGETIYVTTPEGLFFQESSDEGNENES